MAALLLVILQIATLLLIARAILSWIRPAVDSGLYRFRESINRLTDPVVLPVRRVLPNPGGIDLSVIALLLGINLVLVPIATRL